MEAARGALPSAPLVVVLGPEALRLMLAVRRTQRRARIVANADWKRGMATSLLAGLAAVPRRAQAALVLLVDQPRVDAAALHRLVGAWRGASRLRTGTGDGRRRGSRVSPQPRAERKPLSCSSSISRASTRRRCTGSSARGGAAPACRRPRATRGAPACPPCCRVATGA